MPDPEPLSSALAAIDLGSNSFHMIVVRTNANSFQIVDRMRETVRLAAGLNDRNALHDDAIERALACLRRFGERVAGLPRGRVRIVGTHTLRKASNAPDFIRQAEAILGHPVEVISGFEEARMIYLGVSHGLEDDAAQRLVMDIGGGSTELILGRHFEPLRLESLHMGCVSQSAEFFSDGRISAKRMRAAEIAALQQLETIQANYRRLGWQSAIGASGSILSVRDVVIAQGWSDEGISAASLGTLRGALIEAGHVDQLDLKGLSDDRRPVFAGGVAILGAAFEALGLERMRVSESSLREGLVYDQLGRIHHEDVRERTVSELAKRFDIDVGQGARVAAAAEEIREQIAEAWQLRGEDLARLLQWAAQLHEIGLSISHSGHHKHGGYLLLNLDLPGFARAEQERLATLVRGHRRKLSLAEFARFPDPLAKTLIRACVVLRLAVTWHRRRSDEALPEVAIRADDDALKLRYSGGWLDAHPLLRADLEQEAVYLKAAGMQLALE